MGFSCFRLVFSTNPEKWKYIIEQWLWLGLLIGVLASSLQITHTYGLHVTSQVLGIVVLHSLVQEEEHAESAEHPQESTTRLHSQHVEIDGSLGSHAVFPNQLRVLRKLRIRIHGNQTIQTCWERVSGHREAGECQRGRENISSEHSERGCFGRVWRTCERLGIVFC